MSFVLFILPVSFIRKKNKVELIISSTLLETLNTLRSMFITLDKIIILLFFIKSTDSLQLYNPDDLSTAQNKLIPFFNKCLLWQGNTTMVFHMAS